MLELYANFDISQQLDRTLELAIGYFRIKYSADYRDPTTVIGAGLPVNISRQGTWQVYNLKYYGVRTAITGKLPMPGNLTLSGTVGFIPWLEMDYTGLRYLEGKPLWPLDPQPERITGDGTAFDLELAARVVLDANITVDVGYKYYQFSTDGQDQPGTIWAGSWEELTTKLGGPFINLAYQF